MKSPPVHSSGSSTGSSLESGYTARASADDEPGRELTSDDWDGREWGPEFSVAARPEQVLLPKGWPVRLWQVSVLASPVRHPGSTMVYTAAIRLDELKPLALMFGPRGSEVVSLLERIKCLQPEALADFVSDLDGEEFADTGHGTALAAALCALRAVLETAERVAPESIGQVIDDIAFPPRDGLVDPQWEKAANLASSRAGRLARGKPHRGHRLHERV